MHRSSVFLSLAMSLFVTLLTVCVEAADGRQSHSAADGTSHSNPPVKPTPQGKAKSQFNTQIYEQSSEESSFEAVVKVVREVQGDNQVFFEGKQGFFTVTSGASQAQLVKSQQKRAPVKVQVDLSSRQILKVEGP